MATLTKFRSFATSTSLIAFALFVTGCVHYRPDPVDESEVLMRFAQRSLSVDELSDFTDDEFALANLGAYDSADGLSLAEAELAMLIMSPELVAERSRIGISEATASTAGRLDDPVLSLEATRLVENASSASNPWDSRVGLGFVLPVSGRLAVEKKLADTRLQEKIAEYQVRQQSLLQEFRKHWLSYSETLQIQQVLEEYLKDLRDIADLSKRLSDQNVIPRTEWRLLQIELIEREAELQKQKADIQLQKSVLLQMIGVSSTVDVELLPTFEAPENSVYTTDELVEQHPELIRLRNALASAEQAFRLEVRRQYPDLAIGPVGAEEDDLWRLGFELSLPLPLWNKNTQGLAEAEARRNTARAEYEAGLINITTEAEQLALKAKASQSQLDYFREELLPVVVEQIEETRRLAELGNLDVLLLREALSMNYETRSRLIAASRDTAEVRWNLASFLSEPAFIPTSVNESDK